MKKQLLCLVVALLILHLPFFQGFMAHADDPLSPREPADSTTYSEQKIYIPYEHLKDVLEKKEKGILIPYSDFIKLWEEVTRKPPERLLPPPPIDGAIINAEYSGTVDGDMAELHGELKISALKEQWSKVQLNLKGVAITSASLDGKAPLLNPVSEGLELILPKKGKTEEEIQRLSERLLKNNPIWGKGKNG